ncbi:OmpA family protein [Sphingomonas sp.]|uniref:OmpA family protein n=1 Tax=Sphingomonas sp. TaxID=28214 RepID=UPI0039C91AC8
MKKVLGLAAIAAGALAFTQPAAAQTAATPCVAGGFTAFFGANSDKLNAKARAILDKVANTYRTCGQVQVVIAGHTDRKGKDSYNVGLSQRMAVSVRNYLTAQGIPAGSITTQAFGETRPMVDTPDGKAEPQNRRVEITFAPGSGW